jgi:hypothetical protein
MQEVSGRETVMQFDSAAYAVAAEQYFGHAP